MTRHGWQVHATLTILAFAAGLPGCVRRTLTINTLPQGATVILNDEVIGASPVSSDFLWYGDYDVMIRKEGYETLKTNQELKAPWYQLPGLDFFTEILLPFEIHDQRTLEFSLQPAQPVDRKQLIENAEQFRDEALYGAE